MSTHVWVVREGDGDFVEPRLMGVYDDEAAAQNESRRLGANSWVERWPANVRTNEVS